MSYQAMKRHRGKLKYIERSHSEKMIYCIIPTIWHSEEVINYEGANWSMVAGVRGKQGWTEEHTGFLGQWNFNSGHTSLDICSNP